MPEYIFQNVATGERTEIFYKMADAPVIGEEIIHNGGIWRRVCEIGRHQINTHPVTSKFPVCSSSLPTTLADDGSCRLGRDKPGGRLKPIIESAKHKRELMAKFDLVDGI